MSWREFRGYHKLLHERRIEERNNAARQEKGLPPVSRRRVDNSRGPQEPPATVEEH